VEQPKNSPLVVFSHGKETGPWGTKIRRLADVAQAAGWQVLSVDYAALTGQLDAPAQDRLAALLALPLPARGPLVLVGSSMGGWVSAAAAMQLQPAGVFLLAPALGIASYPSKWPQLPLTAELEIIHGWADDVIPWENSAAYAKHTQAQNRTRLHLLPDDHRLGARLDEITAFFKFFLMRCGAVRNAVVESTD
jgi:alpha-beta hydrolase superfamily lysophospholipase